MRFLYLPLAFMLASCIHQNEIKNAGTPHRNQKRTVASDVREGFVDIRNLAKDKKTVCAVTLNSDNEILRFQDRLSAKDFQFVELYQRDKNWMKEATELGVKCDIVVVSGHFGGNFFGSEGMLQLSELEEYSCKNTASGIFHQAKEVFLFGCNTLAGKEKDSRTPEQYRQVLIADGFSETQAQQIAAMRYSPVGQSFSDRMSRVFSGVPRIYGFSSIAPSGINVQDMLDGYLKQQKNYSSYLSRIDNKTNDLLMKSLKVTAITQVQGAVSNQELPQCFLSREDIAETKKIQWIAKTLKNPDTRLVALREISSYLIENKRHGPERAQNEHMLSAIAKDVALRNEMSRIIKAGLNDHPVLRIQLVNIARYFGWLTFKESTQIYYEAVGKYFADKKITQGEADILCSMDLNIPNLVPMDVIKKTQPSESLMYALECLHQNSNEVLQWVHDVVLKDPELKLMVIDYFGRSGSNLPLVRNYLETLSEGGEPQYVNLGLLALGSLGRPTESTYRLHLQLLKQGDQDTQERVIANFEEWNIRTPEYLNALKDIIRAGEDESVELAIVKYFELEPRPDVDVLLPLLKAWQDPESIGWVFQYVIEGIKKNVDGAPRIIEMMMNRFTSDPDNSVVDLHVLAVNPFQDPRLEKFFAQIVRSSKDSESVLKASGGLARLQPENIKVVDGFLEVLGKETEENADFTYAFFELNTQRFDTPAVRSHVIQIIQNGKGRETSNKMKGAISMALALAKVNGEMKKTMKKIFPNSFDD